MSENEKKAILKNGMDYLQSKLTEFLSAKLTSAVKEILVRCQQSTCFLLDLSPSKYFILALIHCLKSHDAILSLILLEQANFFIPKLSEHLKAWFKEEIQFERYEVQDAIVFANFLRVTRQIQTENCSIFEILEFLLHNTGNCLNENFATNNSKLQEFYESIDKYLTSSSLDNYNECQSKNNNDLKFFSVESILKSINNEIQNSDKEEQTTKQVEEKQILMNISSDREDDCSSRDKADVENKFPKNRDKSKKNTRQTKNKGENDVAIQGKNTTESKAEGTASFEVDSGLGTTSETQKMMTPEKENVKKQKQSKEGPTSKMGKKSRCKGNNIELHWAPMGGGWKPLFKNRNVPSALTQEEMTEDLFRKVRAILNKLTFSNLDKLVGQFKELQFQSIELFEGAVEMIVHKAVDEPLFSRAYARLCQNLGNLVIIDSYEGSDGKSFRKILLTRCQQMFEKKKKEETGEEGKKSDDERIAELQKQIAAEDNKEKKKKLQLILEEEVRKIRVKYVGLAKFIGELFKLNMLTANIVHGCIEAWLEKIEEESLECLCKLLTTAGKELEAQSSNHSKDLDKYFIKIFKLSQKSEVNKISNRIRFKLMDVIELRSNNWIPKQKFM